MTSAELKEQLSKQYSAAKDSMSTVRASWDDLEHLALTELANSDQKNRKSRISLGDLATIVLERTGRTVAQLPSGKVRPVSEIDEGNCRIVELALQRYVIPNANDQFSLEDKLFLIDYFSDLYGGIDVLSYWRIDDDYVGPDCQILNPRDVAWQAGKRSKRMSEYVFISTFVSAKWLEDKKRLKQWDSRGINKILDQIKKQAAKPSAREDATRLTANDQAVNQTTTWGDTQEIELVTKYERGKKGRWVSFCPDYDCEVVRDISNPDPLGKIPIISKLPQLPLLDSIQGQGAFKRGASLQKTLDSITNLTHDGLKYAIFPVTKYNGSVVKRSTLKWQPGAFWNMTDLNAVAEHKMGNQVLGTFLPIQQFLGAKMLNQNGTTSTQVAETDKIPGYGKTPKALSMQDKRESTMDRLSRKRLESFWGELMEHWISMLCNKQEKPFDFYIYDEEINQVKALGNDITINKGSRTRKTMDGQEVVVFGSAKMTVKKGDLKGQYRFIVDTSSSMLQEESEEHDRLTEVLTTIMNVGPDVLNAELAKNGQILNISELFKRWVITGGTKDWDDILQDVPQQMGQELPMNQMQQMEQMPPEAGVMGGAMPPQEMPPQMPGFADYQPDQYTLDVMNQIQQGGFGNAR